MRVERLYKQVGRLPALFVREQSRLGHGRSALQWTIVGTVGILLGAYTLGVSFLPLRWIPLFVLGVLSPFIAMIVGSVRRLLLAIIILDIPFHLDTYLAYREDAANLGSIGGLNISATTMALVVLYSLWLSESLGGAPTRSRPFLRMALPFASYCACVGLSLVVAYDPLLSAFELFLLLQAFLLYVYIIGTTRTHQDILFIVTMLMISLVLESVLMIGLRAIGQNINIKAASIDIATDTNTTGEMYRGIGTFGSPNDAGSYFSVLLAPAIGLLLIRRERRYRWLALLAFGLGGVALILTLSRGGWTAAAISITILCLLAWRRGWLSLRVPFVIAVVVMVLSLLFQDAILTRLFGDDRGSAHSRIPLMQLAARIIADHPVLGVGANNFAVIIKQYATPDFGGAWLYTVHNKYLRVWAETGIIGLITFIWFMIATIRRGWQCWNFKDRFLSLFALSFTASIIGQMTHMLVDVYFSRPQIQLLCIIAGIITALNNLQSHGDNVGSSVTSVI